MPIFLRLRTSTAPSRNAEAELLAIIGEPMVKYITTAVLFRANGFELIEEEARRVDIGGLNLADRFVRMDKADLECSVLRLALKRP